MTSVARPGRPPGTDPGGHPRDDGRARIGLPGRLVDAPVWADVAVLAAAAALLVASAVVGRALEAAGAILLVPFPPIFADWAPHVGLGSIPAIACLWGALRLQRAAVSWPWRTLLLRAWLLGLAWIVSLALIDSNRWATKLLSPHEYLAELDRVGHPLTFLQTFTHFIVGVPGAWTTHVSAHPPLATLTFWALDAVGLGGPVWGAIACMVVGSLTLPALAVVIRDLGSPDVARRLLPWGALFPGAVWIGVSADGLFAGVSAMALMACAHGAVRAGARGAWLWSLAGGLGAGAMLYLSYGHVLYGLVFVTAAALSVPVVGLHRAAVAWAVSAVGVLAVVAAFTAAGFVWWEALPLVNDRYFEGIASSRPYSYFVWANLAAQVLAASPMVALVIAWAVRGSRLRPVEPAAWLSLAGLAVILLADLSGLSKAETERIWLTFTATVWVAAGLAPARWQRTGLLLAGASALAVNHLLLTAW